MRFVLLLLMVLLACSACKKEPDDPPVLPEEEGGPAPRLDGAPCGGTRDCDGEFCLSVSDDWRGGYCTTINCAEAGCNNPEGHCVQFLDDTSFCMDGCESNRDCRRGYRCRAVDPSGVKVCDRDTDPGPEAGRIGGACASDDDCDDGATCDDSFPGGYCVGAGCAGTCPLGAVCAAPDDGPFRCMDGCVETRDCRNGYVCDEVGNADVCMPAEGLDVPVTFDETMDALGIVCGGERLSEEGGAISWRVPFEVPAGTISYTVTPLVRIGALRPTAIETPDRTIDLVEEYRHQNLRLTEYDYFDQESQGVQGAVAMDWGLMVPYAPQYVDHVVAGEHALLVETSVDEPCIYVLSTQEPGSRLDLNVYFLGDDFDSASAESDPDIAQVFTRVDEILATADIRLGDVRFVDAPREIAERYGFIRDLSEIKRATAFGAPRDATRLGHLNIDMFLVDDILIGGATVLGLSAGLPGAPGLHGNVGNGLVFTTADLGHDNDFVAHIMAHELGHFLGLRHTTEVVHGLGSDEEAVVETLLGTTDPIEDTPVCERLLMNPTRCPDVENLMFPSAPLEPLDPIVSPGQASVLKGNPFLRPEP